MNLSSSHQKILNVLKNGDNVTTKGLRRKTRVNSISQRIAELRENGYPNIYTNEVKVKGRKTQAYRLGEPTKEMKKAARQGFITLAK